MSAGELLMLLIRPLNRAGIRYVIGGGMAAIFYGEPRLTLGVDVIAFLTDADIHSFAEIYPLGDYYLRPTDSTIADAARVKPGSFNFVHRNTGFKADIFQTGGDELDAWAFRNKRQVDFEGESIVFAPPEHVIVRKLEHFREGGSDKHLRDIRSMLAISGEQIDRAALNEWVRRQGVEAQWKLVGG